MVSEVLAAEEELVASVLKTFSLIESFED